MAAFKGMDMTARRKQTAASARPRHLIEALGKKKKNRPQRKTIHMSEELGDWLKQTASVAEWNGLDLNQSDLVEVAVQQLRDSMPSDPQEFLRKLAV